MYHLQEVIILTTNEPCLIIGKMTQTVSAKYGKILSDSYSIQGITPSQTGILFYLKGNGAQKIRDIAAALNMAESNVSNICSRLEKAGYVQRQRQSYDHRVVKIELAEAAAAKIAAIKVEADALFDRMHKLLTEEDMNDICVGLQKLDMLLDLFLENKLTNPKGI